MKKIIIFVVIPIAFIILLSVLTNNKNRESVSQPSIQPQQTRPLLKEQKDEQGEVAIEVVPLFVTVDAEIWDFKIILNTHSILLDQDMMEVSVLLDDEGKAHQPTQWDGVPPGGHHREGVLRFEPIVPKPQTITLEIKDVGGIEERTFRWDLK